LAEKRHFIFYTPLFCYFTTICVYKRFKKCNFFKRRMQQTLFGEENFFMMDEYLKKENELKIA